MDQLAHALRDAGFNARKPQGSFFLYVRAPKSACGKNGSRVQFSNAEEVSQWLITEKLISTVPWDDAGAYLRFSVTFCAATAGEEERILADLARRLGEAQFQF